MSPAEVSADEITGLAAKAGLKLEEGHAEDYGIMTAEFEGLVASLGDDKLLFPKPNLTEYPRENVHIPEPKDADGGGWATKVGTKDTRICCWLSLIPKLGFNQGNLSENSTSAW